MDMRLLAIGFISLTNYIVLVLLLFCHICAWLNISRDFVSASYNFHTLTPAPSISVPLPLPLPPNTTLPFTFGALIVSAP